MDLGFDGAANASRPSTRQLEARVTASQSQLAAESFSHEKQGWKKAVKEVGARPGLEPGADKPVLMQFASYLGIDVNLDADLLWIAQQALTAPLPEGWEEHQDPYSGDSYFHNAVTGETVWEHPTDSYYQNLYKQLKHEKTARQAQVMGVNPEDMVDVSVGLGGMAGAVSAMGGRQDGFDDKYTRPMRMKAQREREQVTIDQDRELRHQEKLRRIAKRMERRRAKGILVIQRCWRTYFARRNFNQWLREKRAVTLVAARVRGKLFRRRLAEAMRSEVQRIASTEIQRMARGWMGRLYVYRIRRIRDAGRKARNERERVILETKAQRRAALLIQRVFRGHKARAATQMRLDELQADYVRFCQRHAAASLIQWCFREFLIQRQRAEAEKSLKKEEEDPVAVPEGFAMYSDPDGTQRLMRTGTADKTAEEAQRRERLKIKAMREAEVRPPPTETTPESLEQRTRRLEQMGVKPIWMSSTDDGSFGKSSRMSRGGNDDMALHFYKRGQPLVALRYLKEAVQASAVKDQRGAVEAMYSEAISGSKKGRVKGDLPGILGNAHAMATTACNTSTLLASLCKFAEAAKVMGPALRTFEDQAETAALSLATGHVGSLPNWRFRTIERAVAHHNLGVQRLHSGWGDEAWRQLQKAMRLLEEARTADPLGEVEKPVLPMSTLHNGRGGLDMAGADKTASANAKTAKGAQHPYALAIIRSHEAIGRILSAVDSAAEERPGQAPGQRGRVEQIAPQREYDAEFGGGGQDRRGRDMAKLARGPARGGRAPTKGKKAGQKRRVAGQKPKQPRGILRPPRQGGAAPPPQVVGTAKGRAIAERQRERAAKARRSRVQDDRGEEYEQEASSRMSGAQFQLQQAKERGTMSAKLPPRRASSAGSAQGSLPPLSHRSNGSQRSTSASASANPFAKRAARVQVGGGKSVLVEQSQPYGRGRSAGGLRLNNRGPGKYDMAGMRDPAKRKTDLFAAMSDVSSSMLSVEDSRRRGTFSDTRGK